jgi:hypothetical protein
MFGGGLFDSFADHPRQAITRSLGGKPITSTASGAYQFLSRTWDGLVKQYGFTDFSPKNQDLGAVALVAGRGALQGARGWRRAARPGANAGRRLRPGGRALDVRQHRKGGPAMRFVAAIVFADIMFNVLAALVLGAPFSQGAAVMGVIVLVVLRENERLHAAVQDGFDLLRSQVRRGAR